MTLPLGALYEGGGRRFLHSKFQQFVLMESDASVPCSPGLKKLQNPSFYKATLRETHALLGLEPFYLSIVTSGFYQFLVDSAR